MTAKPAEADMPSDEPRIDIFVYGVEPIDAWLAWSDEEQLKASVDRWCSSERRSGFWAFYEAFRDQSMEIARSLGWQGDIREGPFVAGVPTFEIRNTSLFMVAWKQDDDGLTFIASPVRLPWLESKEAVGSLES